MRVWSFTVLLVARVAVAESVPVGIAPFETRCFDAAQLRGRLSVAATVTATGTLSGAHVSVVAADEADGVVVRVVARDVAGRVTGSEVRWLPASDCAASLEAAALIVARAATPLSYRDVPPSKEPRGERPVHRVPVHREPAVAADVPSPSSITPPVTPVSPPAPLQPSTVPPPDSHPAVIPAPRPAVTVREPAPLPATVTPPLPGPPEPVATISKTRIAPPEPWHFHLSVRGQWSFPLDGVPSAPAGELLLGYRFGRWGVELRGGIADDWSRSVVVRDESVGVSARRVPLSLAATVAFRLPRGSVRLQAGPMVALWVVHPDGAARGPSSVIAQPGLTFGAGYRLHLGRLFLDGGVQLDVAFTSDKLTITGAGAVADTPIVAIAPYLGAGVAF